MNKQQNKQQNKQYDKQQNDSVMKALYVFDKNKRPVRSNLAAAADLLGSPERITKYTKFIDKKTGIEGMLSTVFLVIPASYDRGVPVLWDTVIFINNTGQFFRESVRATSHKKAIRQHNEILNAFRNGHKSINIRAINA